MFVCEPVAAARADLALLSGAAVTAAVTAAVKSQRAILRCAPGCGLGCYLGEASIDLGDYVVLIKFKVKV